MNYFFPQIGDHLQYLQNNGNKKHLIYTKTFGYVPNDIEAESHAWESSTNCGMSECMNKQQFNIWWANQIEKKYQEYKQQQQQTCKGCLEFQASQKYHMEPSGCLYDDNV